MFNPLRFQTANNAERIPLSIECRTNLESYSLLPQSFVVFAEKLCPQRREQVLNTANIRSFAVNLRFREPNIARSISAVMFFHILWIDFRASIPNSSSSSCIGIADLDIRVLKLNKFYESTLVMAKLWPELRKCLTNIRSSANLCCLRNIF